MIDLCIGLALVVIAIVIFKVKCLKFKLKLNILDKSDYVWLTVVSIGLGSGLRLLVDGGYTWLVLGHGWQSLISSANYIKLYAIDYVIHTLTKIRR